MEGLEDTDELEEAAQQEVDKVRTVSFEFGSSNFFLTFESIWFYLQIDAGFMGNYSRSIRKSPGCRNRLASCARSRCGWHGGFRRNAIPFTGFEKLKTLNTFKRLGAS